MAIDLAYTERGSGPPVIISHGLFGWKRNWAAIAKGLSAKHQVFAIDMRNHGESPHAPEMTYEAMASDLERFIETRVCRPVPVIGHSMGGKASMMLALSRPDLVERLLLLDIAPVAYDHDYSGYVAAMKNIDLAAVSRRADVEPLIAAVAENPGICAFLMQNLTTDATGRYKWRVHLGAIETHMDEILDFPDVDSARAYNGRTLFLGGQNSTYLAPQHHSEIKRLFPMAETAFIENAGHWVHAEQPQAVLERFQAFLA